MSFYQARTVSKTVKAHAAGDYRIHLYCKIDGEPAPRDPQECRIHVTSDGDEFFTDQYHWADNDWFQNDCEIHWEAGDHTIAFTTEPVHPELKPLRTKMEYRLVSVRVEGPRIESYGYTLPASKNCTRVTRRPPIPGTPCVRPGSAGQICFQGLPSAGARRNAVAIGRPGGENVLVAGYHI